MNLKEITVSYCYWHVLPQDRDKFFPRDKRLGEKIVKQFRQCTYKGIVYENYYVSRCGMVLGANDRFLTPNVSGKSTYPKVAIGSKYDSRQPRKTVPVHKLVANSWMEVPLPEGVTQEEWDRTPESVKALIETDYWEVDHIDSNPLNFHVDNLRYMSRTANKNVYYAEQRFLKNA